MDPLNRLLLGFAPLYAPDDEGGGGGGGDDGGKPPEPDPEPVNPHAGGDGDGGDGGDGGKPPVDGKPSAADIRAKAGGLHTDKDEGGGKPEDGKGDDPNVDLTEKPDYLPAKFFDAETKEANVEGLAAAYTTLEKAHNKLKGEKKIDAPKEASEYFAGDDGETFLGDVAKDAPNVPLEGGLEDPGLKVFSDVMHKHNVSKAEALDIAREVMVGMNDKLMPQIDPQAELEELGKDGQQQVDEITTWADGMFDNGILGEAEAEMLYNITATAAGVRLIQKFRKEYGERIDIPALNADNAEFMSRDDWTAALGKAFEKSDEAEVQRLQALGDQMWPDKA